MLQDPWRPAHGVADPLPISAKQLFSSRRVCRRFGLGAGANPIPSLCVHPVLDVGSGSTS